MTQDMLNARARELFLAAVPDQECWAELRRNIADGTVTLHSDPVSWIAASGLSATRAALQDTRIIQERDDFRSCLATTAGKLLVAEQRATTAEAHLTRAREALEQIIAVVRPAATSTVSAALNGLSSIEQIAATTLTEISKS